MMSRLPSILVGLLLAGGTVQVIAQGEAPRDFSAQGPGADVRTANAQAADPLFVRTASDGEDGRPSLPRGLRDEATQAEAPEHQGEPGRSHHRAAPADTPDTPGTPAPGGPAQPLRLPLASRASDAQEQDKPLPWLSLDAERSISSMLGGLSIVLGVFLLLVWALRKRMPKGSARLPDEIIEVLGRTTLAAKQSLHLVRVGGKLIVVSVTAGGTETLTEITDPGEVARIMAACQRHHHGSTTDFRRVLEQLGREPARGFLESEGDRRPLQPSGTEAA